MANIIRQSVILLILCDTRGATLDHLDRSAADGEQPETPTGPGRFGSSISGKSMTSLRNAADWGYGRVRTRSSSNCASVRGPAIGMAAIRQIRAAGINRGERQRGHKPTSAQIGHRGKTARSRTAQSTNPSQAGMEGDVWLPTNLFGQSPLLRQVVVGREFTASVGW